MIKILICSTCKYADKKQSETPCAKCKLIKVLVPSHYKINENKKKTKVIEYETVC